MRRGAPINLAVSATMRMAIAAPSPRSPAAIDRSSWVNVSATRDLLAHGYGCGATIARMRGLGDLAVTEFFKYRPVARKLDAHLQLNRWLAFCNRNIFRLLYQQPPDTSSFKGGYDGKLAEIKAVGLFPV